MKKKLKTINNLGVRKLPPQPVKEPQELLTDALVLGLTAPTDAEVDRAVALAERVAALCSELEIFAAKRNALTRVCMIRGAQ